MFLKNIFTNFWSNIIVLIIFVVFMIKVFLEQNTFKKSIKIKFNDFFVMLCMGIAFVAGVAVISFAILPLEKNGKFSFNYFAQNFIVSNFGIYT